MRTFCKPTNQPTNQESERASNLAAQRVHLRLVAMNLQRNQSARLSSSPAILSCPAAMVQMCNRQSLEFNFARDFAIHKEPSKREKGGEGVRRE